MLQLPGTILAADGVLPAPTQLARTRALLSLWSPSAEVRPRAAVANRPLAPTLYVKYSSCFVFLQDFVYLDSV